MQVSQETCLPRSFANFWPGHMETNSIRSWPDRSALLVITKVSKFIFTQYLTYCTVTLFSAAKRQLRGLEFWTYFLIYCTVTLFSAPEIPHFLIYRTVTLFSATFYFNHISNNINTIVELNINNCSKISYLSSLIFPINWDVYKWCFYPPEMVEFREKFQGWIFCEVI